VSESGGRRRRRWAAAGGTGAMLSLAKAWAWRANEHAFAAARKHGTLALAAGAIALALAAWAMAATGLRAGIVPTTPKADPRKPALQPLEGGPKESEAFRLPANFRSADGSFNQDAILAEQKKRAEIIQAKLSIRLAVVETPHYLVLSSAGASMTASFAKWSEALYANLSRQFAMDPKQRVWDGKCLLLVFGSRSEFVAYAKIFDGSDAANAAAYFAWERHGVGTPQLVHICIPTNEPRPARLQELFVHEGTHAFFQLYRHPVVLPVWLQEGLAEYMTVVNDPSLSNRKALPAVAIARQRRPIGRVLAADTLSLDGEEYSVAYTLVDALIRTDPVRFRQFVNLLKDGKGQDEALKAAYGFDLAGLAERWRVVVLRTRPAAGP